MVFLSFPSFTCEFASFGRPQTDPQAFIPMKCNTARMPLNDTHITPVLSIVESESPLTQLLLKQKMKQKSAERSSEMSSKDERGVQSAKNKNSALTALVHSVDCFGAHSGHPIMTDSNTMVDLSPTGPLTLDFWPPKI